jgi:hypothetical protein
LSPSLAGKRCSWTSRQDQKGYADFRTPPAFVSPRVIFISHFLILWQFTYFSRAHECPKHTPGKIIHHQELHRNPNTEEVSEISY